jgi:hypothetical protein
MRFERPFGLCNLIFEKIPPTERNIVPDTALQQNSEQSTEPFIFGFLLLAVLVMVIGTSAFILVIEPKIHTDQCTSHSTTPKCNNYNSQLKQYQNR